MLVVILQTDVLQTGEENQSVLYNIIEDSEVRDWPSHCLLLYFDEVKVSYAVYKVLCRNICSLFMYPSLYNQRIVY